MSTSSTNGTETKKAKTVVTGKNTTNTDSVGGQWSITAGRESGGNIGGNSSTTTDHSQGGQATETYNNGTSTNLQRSGGQQNTTGMQRAVGAVDQATQAAYNRYNSGTYQQSGQVAAAYNKLQGLLNQGQDQFQSSYTDQLNDIYQKIANREPFQYNLNGDQLYQMYKDQYVNAGRQAMVDTNARAAAMTGGYGNSYANTAGQQAYQGYLSQLNDIVPELYDRAYNQYQQEGQDLQNLYGLASDAYNRDYELWRANVGDYQTDRNFDYGLYSDERNFDYSKYTSDRDYAASQYWNQLNSAISNTSDSTHSDLSQGRTSERSNSTSNSKNWSDSTSNTDAFNWGFNWSENQQESDSLNWNHANTTDKQKQTTTEDSTVTNNSTTVTDGGGSGGSGGGSGSSGGSGRSGSGSSGYTQTNGRTVWDTVMSSANPNAALEQAWQNGLADDATLANIAQNNGLNFQHGSFWIVNGKPLEKPGAKQEQDTTGGTSSSGPAKTRYVK